MLSTDTKTSSSVSPLVLRDYAPLLWRQARFPHQLLLFPSFQAVEELLESLELEKSSYHMGLSKVSTVNAAAGAGLRRSAAVPLDAARGQRCALVRGSGIFNLNYPEFLKDHQQESETTTSVGPVYRWRKRKQL